MVAMCPPTPQEAVGAALKAAGYDMASYQRPNLRARPPFLGTCTPGWIAENSYGDFVIVAYRPAGIMSAEDSYAVQAAQLDQYLARVFTGPGWEAMPDRRKTGIPALLVRKAARDE